MSRFSDWIRKLLDKLDPIEPPPPPVGNYSRALLDAHNVVRSARGLSKLALNPILTTLAEKQSAWQAEQDQTSHTGANGSDPFSRIRSSGYLGSGSENVAMGLRSLETAREAVDAWMDSSGHRANVLGAGWRDFGGGSAISRTGRRYWTAVYGDGAVVTRIMYPVPAPLKVE